MTKLKVIVTIAALTCPILGFGLPAMAATAHNLQTGAHTSNVYDDAQSAAVKQQKQEEQSFWSAARR